MSIVTYNGVHLTSCLTHVFEQVAINDESGTDRLGYKYTISVETFANVAAAAGFFGLCGVQVPGTTVTELIAGVRDLLMARRQSFSYSQNGVTMVAASASNDLDQGPNPVSFRLTHITPTTVKIEYTISFTIDDCHGSQAFPVISNRWSCVDSIDERWRTTRSWHGKLRMGTSQNGTVSPHNFRALVVPTLQAGWIRQKMNFVASPNGLELGYEITDQQLLGDAAPWPCATWSFTHNENMQFVGSKNTGSLDITMRGTPRANKYDMITFGLLLLKLKLIDSQNIAIGQSIIQGITVTEMGGNDECAIAVRGHVIRVPNQGSGVNQGQSIGNISLRNVGKPLDKFNIQNYNKDLTINYGPFGTNDPALLAGLFACYLQTPCGDLDSHTMPQGGPQPSQPKTKGGSSTSPKFQYDSQSSTTPTEISASVGSPGDPSIPSPTMSADQTTAMYIHSKGDSTLELDGGYIGLPIAKAKNSSNADNTAFIQLYPPQCTRTLRFEFERIVEWPILIKPIAFTDKNGIKYKVKHWEPKFHAPVQTSDGHTLFVVDVELELLMSRPPKDGETIPTCEMPWDTFKPAATAYPPNKFIEPTDSDNGIQ